MNLWIIFITGLTSGGLSCLAMQGGLLASLIANQNDKKLNALSELSQKESNDRINWKPVAYFLVAKLIAHIILGFLLGLLGAVFTLSLELRLLFQVLAAFFMFATAMNLLNVHPLFRFVALQPPAFLTRRIRQSTKNTNWFAPMLLGVLTIFIPCGVTQAMEVTAISSGTPLQGALILGAFVAGTIPLFAILGVATAKLSEGLQRLFLHTAAVVLIGLSIMSFNGVLEVLNAPLSWSSVVAWVEAPARRRQAASMGVAPIENGVQKITIQITNNGYNPNKFTVSKGIPVQLTLQSTDTYSCALDFRIKKYDIAEFLGPNDTRVVTFLPSQAGRIPFSCSMGMYTGTIEVI